MAEEYKDKFMRDTDIGSEAWFDMYEYDFRADPKYIDMGYRKKTIASCQYYVNNLPVVCKFWDKTRNKCGYTFLHDDVTPSAYNNSHCDFMGRASRCDRYKASESDGVLYDPEYRCVAINPFLSGLLDTDGKPIKSNDVLGYNEGLCDGQGCGRGAIYSEDLNELVKYPVVCNYYRPWQMSVGLTLPQSYEDLITKTGPIRSYSAEYYEALRRYTEDHSMGVRLPFYFVVCNMRSRFQKCLYWDRDYGASFVLDKDQDGQYYISLEDVNSGQSPCLKSNDTAIAPYTTVATNSVYWLLREVWSEAGGVVCNGARPDCPCYTGEWLYCTNDAMQNSMRVTANQIMELRFWTNDWSSQKEYDDYFLNRPNWVDTSTADLYTFSHYAPDSYHSSGRLMVGERLHMCMPANVWNKYFDPTVYVEHSQLTFTGGEGEGTSEEETQYYPTLMREPWDYLQFNQFYLLFPFVDNEFDDETKIGCEKDKKRPAIFEKYTNNPEFDFISVIGQTIRNKKVYVINTSIAGDCGALNKYLNVTTMPYKEQREAAEQLDNYIYDTKVNFPDVIAEGNTDVISGTFIVGPVRLNVNALNRITVIVKLDTDKFDFRHRLLYSFFCGAVLQQTYFKFDTENRLYQSWMGLIDPPAEAGGKLLTFGKADAAEMYPAHSMIVYSYMGEESIYAYSIEKEDVNDDLLWTPVGNSSYVMVYLKDTKVNHIFRWGVDSASMIYTKPTDITTPSVGSEPCATNKVEMELVFPSGDYSDIIIDGNNYKYLGTSYSNTQDQGFVVPGLLVLKPKKKEDEYRRFSKLSWELDINAWAMVYKVTESAPSKSSGKQSNSRNYDNSTAEGDTRTAPHVPGADPQKVKVPYELDISGDEFKVENFSIGPVGIVGFANDPRNKYVSASAIKVYVYASYAMCRSVEVDHAYRSSAKEEALNPWHGWALAPGGGYTPTGNILPQYYHTRCGDHLTSFSTGKGPMWYPHDSCADADIYEVWAMCASCVSPYEGVPRDDMRFCMTQSEVVYGDTPRSNWASACGIQCYFTRGVFDTDLFAGYANYVASVNEEDYRRYGWRLPPFGNLSRNFVDRNLCKDYISYVAPALPLFRSAWAPTIIDNTVFTNSFNAFESYSRTNALDLFSFSDTLNYGLCNQIDEEFDSEHRYRWEEVFDIRLFHDAFYPKPILSLGGKSTCVGYVFREQNVAWAWREFWAPIQRSDELSHIKLLRPEYRYDLYKAEHRYITDEGETVLKFKAPVREGSKYVDDYPPTLALGNGPPRMFEFLLSSNDKYDDTAVRWLDHYDGEDTVYSKTTGSNEFDHDYNLLFDADYAESFEEAESKDRVRLVAIDIFGDEIKQAYNRGVICKFKRSTLPYFPIKTQISLLHLTQSLPKISDTVKIATYTWLYTQVPTVQFIGAPTNGEAMAIQEIVIEGIWGFFDYDLYFCQPRIEINCTTPEGTGFSLKGFNGISARKANLSKLEPFTIKLSYLVTPFDMIKRRVESININISSVEEESLAVDLPSFVLADQWQSVEEKIKIFERKYFVSRFTNPGNDPNPDTHEGVLLPRNRGGSFFPYHTSMFSEGYKSMNKMRGCWAGKHYPMESREPISISIQNMTRVELEMQQKEYEETLDMDEVKADVLTFTGATPPYFTALKSLLNTVDTPFQPKFLDITFDSPVMKWTDFKGYHELYKVYNHWKPGGHSWGWGDNIVRQNCKVFDVVRDTQQP